MKKKFNLHLGQVDMGEFAKGKLKINVQTDAAVIGLDELKNNIIKTVNDVFDDLRKNKEIKDNFNTIFFIAPFIHLYPTKKNNVKLNDMN